MVPKDRSRMASEKHRAMGTDLRTASEMLDRTRA